MCHEHRPSSTSVLHSDRCLRDFKSYDKNQKTKLLYLFD
jgi:hypothetical protein